MTDPDRLLDEFIAEHRAGAAPDPGRYLDRLEGAERAELKALIDAYLARAPRRRWDPEAFANSPAREVADAVARSLGGASGAWPVLLPRLRTRARLRRDELVHRLADDLGVADREESVAAYYHRMERGTLPAAGVSQRVLDALAGIVGVGAEALRRAGEAIEPAARGEAADAVFTRLAEDDEAAGEPAGEAQTPSRAPGVEPDEVDELFTGGGAGP